MLLLLCGVLQIMLLNGSHDRETGMSGAHEGPMKASDMVQAVTDALNRRRARQGQPIKHLPAAYVTTLIVPNGGEIEVDTEALGLLGVHHVVEVESHKDKDGRCLYDAEALVLALGTVLYERGVLTC